MLLGFPHDRSKKCGVPPHLRIVVLLLYLGVLRRCKGSVALVPDTRAMAPIFTISTSAIFLIGRSLHPTPHALAHAALLLVLVVVAPRRGVRPEGDARISWIEAYLAGNPGTVIVDPVDRVANCINRVTTLEVC